MQFGLCWGENGLPANMEQNAKTLSIDDSKEKKNIKMLSRYKIGGSNCEKSFQPLTPQIGPTLKRRQATSVERSI